MNEQMPEVKLPQMKLDNFVRDSFAFKFKDKANRQQQVISAKDGNMMVIKEIILRKVPNQNNLIEVVLIMPRPEFMTQKEEPREAAKGAKA